MMRFSRYTLCLILLALLVPMSASAAPRLTAEQAQRALEMTTGWETSEILDVVTSWHVDGCRWRPRRNFWTCHQHMSGVGDMGLRDANGQIQVTEWGQDSIYTIRGACRNAVVRISPVDVFDERATRHNVCRA